MSDVAIALSIQQPWAWLIVNGYKDVENRTWATRKRGRILIHAGKKIDMEGRFYMRLRYPTIPLPSQFDCGGIVGSARIVDCVEHSDSPWFCGPYGFVLAEAKPLPFIVCPGRLGLFPVTVSV